jgi:CheY-like chemotaxis protein
VRLFLPREHASRLPAADPAPLPAEDVVPARILLVEDNDDVRAAGLEVLRSMGHTVLVAGNGAAALEILGGGAEVDLLLSDVVMPGGLDGPGLAAAARRLRPNLPVLLTSGYAAGVLGEAVDEYAFIPKPFKAASLARALKSVLARDRMQVASTRS